MPRTQDTSVLEKQRARAEIASQIEEFLRNGGRIEVLDKESQSRTQTPSIGNVWHTNDDLVDISD